MFRSVVILCLVLSCYARPEINVQNVITVPPNCPPGQELINGVCRDVWKSRQSNDVSGIPEGPRCSPGEVWFDGRCLQTLRSAVKTPKEVITVPPNCPPGQQFENGQCREVWRALFNPLFSQHKSINPTNVVTVPSNCKPPLEWVNGECKEVWLRDGSQAETSTMELAEKLVNQLKDLVISEDRIRRQLEEETNDLGNRKVISIPNHCPQGYRPDSQGVCRESFD